jgi:hypothetical protein
MLTWKQEGWAICGKNVNQEKKRTKPNKNETKRTIPKVGRQTGAT